MCLLWETIQRWPFALTYSKHCGRGGGFQYKPASKIEIEVVNGNH